MSATDKHIIFFLFLSPFILVMDVQAFERLLGPCMEILKRNIANYEEQLVALFGTNMDIADPSA